MSGSLKRLAPELAATYEVREWRHALAILEGDFPDEWRDLQEVLRGFRLTKSDILAAGGAKSRIASAIDEQFARRGWVEKQFQVKVVVDDASHDTPTHNVDYFKNRIAIEMEWNNKDPFFDRDLNNFRLLHQLDVVSVGVIITRSSALQALFDGLGPDVRAKYGASTTHMAKLLPRVEGGGAGGCPLVVFGITKALYDPEG
jgi:hypothetical protein